MISNHFPLLLAAGVLVCLANCAKPPPAVDTDKEVAALNADLAAFEELLPRLKSLELAGEPRRTTTNFVGGPKTLPIRYAS
jgi:hypothetical protein